MNNSCLKRSISTHEAIPWTCLKVFLFCICFSGFAYQGKEFLDHYWTYPTALDIAIERNRELFEPAVTFCNANRIERSKFCKEYPDECEFLNKRSSMCTDNPDYCERLDSQSLVPRKEAFDYRFTVNDTINLGRSIDRFLGKRNALKFRGPYVYIDEVCNSVCYTTAYEAYTKDNPQKIKLQEDFESMFDLDETPSILYLVLHVSPNETLYPSTTPGVVFHIHSPFEMRKPTIEGTFLKAGTEAVVRVQLEEEYLLPYPYKTDCTNYTYEREIRNNTGPRSQHMCKQRCAVVEFVKKHGCHGLNLQPVLFEGTKGAFPDWCRLDDKEKLFNYSDCKKECKADCVKLKYSYTTKIKQEGIPDSEEIFLEIRRGKEEILVLRHTPKYQAVEFFSTFGGFLSIWLGISLFSLADVIKYNCTYMTSKLKGTKELSVLLEV